jgi:hypothetical protein
MAYGIVHQFAGGTKEQNEATLAAGCESWIATTVLPPSDGPAA